MSRFAIEQITTNPATLESKENEKPQAEGVVNLPPVEEPKEIDQLEDAGETYDITNEELAEEQCCKKNSLFGVPVVTKNSSSQKNNETGGASLGTKLLFFGALATITAKLL